MEVAEEGATLVPLLAAPLDEPHEGLHVGHRALREDEVAAAPTLFGVLPPPSKIELRRIELGPPNRDSGLF